MANPMLVQVGADLADLRAQHAAGRIDIAQFAAGVEEISNRFTATGVSADRLRTSLQSIDGVLASVGLNISASQRGLIDLANASGKTAAQLGAIGTAGLVVGAAMGGWELGKKIDEVTGLSTAIGNGIANLLGMGDSAEVAGARADVLAKASRSAGIEIKDMALAMAINEAEAKRMSTAAIEANDAILRLDGPKKSAEAIAGWNAELEKVRSAGVLAGLRADIESHNFSVKELASNYRISAEAVQFLTREMGEEDKVHKKNAETIKKTAEELKHWSELNAEVSIGTGNFQGVLDTIDGAIVDYAEDLLKSGVAAQTVAEYLGLTRTQVRALEADLRAKTKATQEAAAADLAAAEAADKLRAALDAEAQVIFAKFTAANSAVMGIDLTMKGWNATIMGSVSMLGAMQLAATDTATQIRTLSGEIISVAEAQKRWTMGNSITYDLSTPQGIADYRKLNPSAAIQWSNDQIMAFIKAGGTLQQLINQGVINPYAGYSPFPGRASGGDVIADRPYVVGERGPEVFVPRASGAIVPNGAGGVTNHISIAITQPLGTPQAIAAAVDNALTKRAKQLGWRTDTGV